MKTYEVYIITADGKKTMINNYKTLTEAQHCFDTVQGSNKIMAVFLDEVMLPPNSSTRPQYKCIKTWRRRNDHKAGRQGVTVRETAKGRSK